MTPRTSTLVAKERILEAALHVLAEQGLARTTIRAIAAKAGVATGLVNYHFKTRATLLSAVIDASRTRFIGELQSRAPALTGLSGPETARALLELGRSLVGWMPDWYRLSSDIDTMALRDADFTVAAAQSKRAGEGDVHHYLRIIADSFGVSATRDLRPLAAVVLTMLDGLATRQLIDPGFDPDPAYAELERIVISAFSTGARPLTRPWNPDPLGLGSASKRNKPRPRPSPKPRPTSKRATRTRQ